MDIAKILLSLIMTGLAASLVFVQIALKEVRSDISRLRSVVYNNEYRISELRDELKRLNEIHKPQIEVRKQQEREFAENIDRYIKGTL